MFDIKVVIPGVFETPEDVHDPHDPEEVLDMAFVMKKPSTFRNVDWEIIDRNTGEILVSWKAGKEKVSPIVFEALKRAE